MERVLILNEQSALLYPSILTDSLKMDYPFQIPVYSCLLPSEKIGEGVSVGEGATIWKQPITKFPCPVFLMIAKDCTERLSAVALSVGLIIPRG